MNDKTHGRAAPCPFCGGGRVEVCPTNINSKGRWIRCMTCGCEGPVGGSESDALNRWNLRAK